MPMMALSGVRISWLMRRKKSSCTWEARWASSSEVSACDRACMACWRLLRAHISTSFNSLMREKSVSFMRCNEANMPASSSLLRSCSGSGSSPAATLSAYPLTLSRGLATRVMKMQALPSTEAPSRISPPRAASMVQRRRPSRLSRRTKKLAYCMLPSLLASAAMASGSRARWQSCILRRAACGPGRAIQVADAVASESSFCPRARLRTSSVMLLNLPTCARMACICARVESSTSRLSTRVDSATRSPGATLAVSGRASSPRSSRKRRCQRSRWAASPVEI